MSAAATRDELLVLPGLDRALATIAARAGERERAEVAPFPADAFDLLRQSGALATAAIAGEVRPPAAAELALVRAVAAADASVGRILDGHVNAVERLAVHGRGDLRARELARVAAGTLTAGVWGADPRPGEGPPAQLLDVRDGERPAAGTGHAAGERAAGRQAGAQHAVGKERARDERAVGEAPVARLRGVKTFCSGAGGLDRALVLARRGDGPPVAAWVDLTRPGEVEVDEGWFRPGGMRASASHRVVFHDAAVLAVLGEPGALVRQPWFGRDALRTAASWAGIADAVVEAALEELARRPGRGSLEELAAGELLARRATIDLWIAAAAEAMDRREPAELTRVSALARRELAATARELLDVAARACGSHPFATGGRLDRARRDLELFLLQHRLEPIVARAGAVALDALDVEERP